ncbi:MAG: chemotaxis protein CheW, partial [Acetatifactor sp.]|nr:chemotaxis protein CheW [Acetatifactor sp.]
RKSVEDGMVLIFEVEGKAICLFVDRLIGEQEIVVKPIPSYIKKVKGLSGCTQLGDGSIALILDPVGLIE